MANQDFGSDELNKPRIVVEFILLLAAIALMLFFTINTTMWNTAQVFMWTGVIGGLGLTIAFMMKGVGKTDVFDVMISEKPMFNINRKFLYVIFFIMFIFSFAILANTEFRLAAPPFQTVDLGLEGEVLLFAGAAFIEDVFFFILMPGLVFSIMYWLLKRRSQSSGGAAFWVSLVGMVIATPLIFMFYHLAVYGFANQAAMAFVFLFGLENIIMLVIFRDVTYVHARHIGNNVGLLVFSLFSVETLITVMFTSLWFWGVVALVVVLAYVKYRRSKA